MNASSGMEELHHMLSMVALICLINVAMHAQETTRLPKSRSTFVLYTLTKHTCQNMMSQHASHPLFVVAMELDDTDGWAEAPELVDPIA